MATDLRRQGAKLVVLISSELGLLFASLWLAALN